MAFKWKLRCFFPMLIHPSPSTKNLLNFQKVSVTHNSYKCNCKGCKTNVSAKKLYGKYEELLSRYDIPQPLVNILRDIISKLI